MASENFCENVTDIDVCNTLDNCHYCGKWYTCEYIPGYHYDISKQKGWFIGGFIIQILCFIIIMVYLVRYLYKLIHPTSLPDELAHIVDRIHGWKMKYYYYMAVPLPMILCMISIGADFYHLLLPLIESINDKHDNNRYPCGIRDSNFNVTRFVADASQFWGYLVYLGIMGYKLVVSFHASPFALTFASKSLLVILFCIVVFITGMYNICQLSQTDNGNITRISFSIYTVTSIALNVIILGMYSFKLNELIVLDIEVSVTDDNMDENQLRQKKLLKSMTKCAVLIGIQLIFYSFRYLYRIAIVKPDINNRNQLLYIISYAGRDIMCVAIVIALYYGCSFIKNEYDSTCKCCDRCCGRICYKITKNWITIHETNGNDSDNAGTTTIIAENSEMSDTAQLRYETRQNITEEPSASY
mmetsp:Transcript_86943/g.106628  ORF Transcript_86943/g.106628 Transcript_86943/m.106628 type:complete len:414 (-) Transcript_86943:128-1369(-)